MFGDADFIKAIKMEHPTVIPTSVGVMGTMWIHHGDDMVRLVKEYPQFFNEDMIIDYSDPTKIAGGTYRAGTHIDEWGCVWENIDEGLESIVKGHPVKSPEDVFDLEIPTEYPNYINHGFMYLRLLDLCGFENAMMMFAEEGEEIEVLIKKVLQYNKNLISRHAPSMSQISSLGDDLGMQTGIPIGAERWRKYMKPCFAELFGHLKKLRPDICIHMHTDGCVHEIMPDLIECGADIINPQFRANGIENLVRVCRREHTIPIHLDLDRQLFPFATRSQIFDHVAECVEELYMPEGGLALYAELNYDIPIENCVAILDAMEKYRHYKK